MGALDHIVRSGKALYVGISNYNAEQTAIAVKTLRAMGTPMLIHQPRYNMLDRWIENGLTDVLREEGVGSIVFSPLAGGRLTGKYQNGIPADSRAGHDPRYLKPTMIDDKLCACTAALAEIAKERGQTTAQLALQWVLRDKVVTSALIGASRPQQVIENIAALSFPDLTQEELAQIENALALLK
jgi:L-glyceraldehyde 3-phosphate reductase